MGRWEGVRVGIDTEEWGGRGSVDRHEWEGRRAGTDSGSVMGGGESGERQEEWGGRGREWG